MIRAPIEQNVADQSDEERHFFTARCAQDAKVAKGSKEILLTK
jgi:hypothetical protein